MYRDEALQHYLDDLASASPTPGGGSASAFTGSLGAALASMVARLTLGKAEYAAVESEMQAILQATEELRARFLQLMQEDIDAYSVLSAAFKLPRANDEEKAARSQAIQGRLVEAALVPLEVAECAAALLAHCERIATVGNKNVLSDVATGAALASSAGAGAAWMVRVNLQSMRDLEMVNILSNRLGAALDQITTRGQRVTNIVGERV